MTDAFASYLISACAVGLALLWAYDPVNRTYTRLVNRITELERRAKLHSDSIGELHMVHTVTQKATSEEFRRECARVGLNYNTAQVIGEVYESSCDPSAAALLHECGYSDPFKRFSDYALTAGERGNAIAARRNRAIQAAWDSSEHSHAGAGPGPTGPALLPVRTPLEQYQYLLKYHGMLAPGMHHLARTIMGIPATDEFSVRNSRPLE